jgi:hypothetical protein
MPKASLLIARARSFLTTKCEWSRALFEPDPVAFK